jgi:hypothetical protein
MVTLNVGLFCHEIPPQMITKGLVPANSLNDSN